MYGFRDLKIWNDLELKSKLNWYYQVAMNKKPAKYLIARKIACDIDLKNTSIDDLWEYHKNLSDKFTELWHRIKSDEIEISDLPQPDTSLMDLNTELVNRMLRSCNFCRWNCKIDRTLVDDDPSAKTGTCQLGEKSRVSSYFHHRGEELIFRGVLGSGTIFFTSCNLRCVFCQNGDISKDKNNGAVLTPNELSDIFILLREEGVHNINLVGGDPSVHLHTIINAIHELDNHELRHINKIIKVKSDFYVSYPRSKLNSLYHDEFNVPILWNSNFFMSEEAFRILLTVIDVWLPDLKFYNNKCATRLCRTPWYFDTVSKFIKELYDRGEDFSIRHLIMPNHLECCTYPILDWMSKSIPRALINLMDQYHPDSYTNPNTREYNPRYKDINRKLTNLEINNVMKKAVEKNINHEIITYN